MYLPILRGKQNELLALKELLNEKVLSENILPIIEPTSPSSTFKNLLMQFSEQNRKIAVIQNSEQVPYESFDTKEVTSLKKKSNFISALIVQNNAQCDFSKFLNANRMIIVDEKSEFNDSNKIEKDTYVVVEPNNRTALRLFKNSADYLVEYHDQFNKQERNVDYLDKEDEIFSVEHKFYEEDGYFGFSDYSIIGSDFRLSGFAAKAVAIHLVYFDKDFNLRIHHFVSDSNENINDPAKKAHEALEKLVEFVNSNEFVFKDNRNNSSGLKEFKRLFNEDKYSGLGYIKKLSIKHHFEILGRYLDKWANVAKSVS
ncbi:sce7725 family protein [Companilactobacillus formosensis]|uniref:sce7725 family protein n=1 Tax=Companilactobacillus formosensis TaxID=1617889 RepID=UPI000E65BC95|nr:sce7725 family protein [Companilactobacillus formosensis]